MPLFALLTSAPLELRRVGLTPALEGQVDELLKSQLEAFLPADVDRVAFDVRHRPDESQVCYIDNFQAGPLIFAAIENPIAVAMLKQDDVDQVRGLVGVVADRPNEILLQKFDGRQILARRGLTVVLASDVFSRLEHVGFSIRDSSDAVLQRENDRVEFREISAMRRMFDMGHLVREATDGEVRRFATLATVSADGEVLLRNCDNWVRKKIALVLETDMLSTRPLKEIAANAQAFGLSLSTVIDEQNVERLEIPTDMKSLKALLRFLDDDYFASELTGRKYISNSKLRKE